MKKISLVIMIFAVAILSSGCFKRDSLEGIEIVTTVYPLEYITSQLYGEHSVVNSIYPDGTNTNTYKLSKKQINDFSEKYLFIYNGLSSDKDIAINFLEKNKDMLIIDSSNGMELTYGNAELWLNPSNLLMMTQNVRNGLKEYITNSYLEKSIDSNYEKLKIKLSELDAEIKLTVENSDRKLIVVNDDSLKFLEKYGLTVISLDDSIETPSDKTIQTVKGYIANGSIKNIILLENTDINKTVKSIIDDTKVSTITLRNATNITDTERDTKYTYVDIINKDIELLKSEIYN